MSQYSIRLYIGITTSISLASSTCVLLISSMHLINGAQFLNLTFLLGLFAAASAAAVLETLIIPLICMYASL